MNSRILKQYEDAIRACRMNKPVDTSELPCPLGYPPLPSSGTAVAPASATSGTAAPPKRPLPEVGPFAAPEQTESGRQSRQKQQLDFLLKRQMQFKQAAVAAKNKGDIEAAKKFLLAAKVTRKYFKVRRSRQEQFLPACTVRSVYTAKG
ncbi:unnamed protein product [Gongylonema pulchrum]|uniref:DM domain-containing protein n=1 Tax=Gongylonema pulchrum TaxID=637853 RepID=A0A183D8S3_9BILA|nr:unnamed protein product [Gongylonema pulchrum]